MSRTTDIELHFEDPVRIGEVIDRLSLAGATTCINHEASYVVDCDSMFDWKSTPCSEIAAIIEEVDRLDHPDGATFGITILLDTSQEIGGDLLFHSGGRVVSFMAEINRKRCPASEKIADICWYLSRLLLPLDSLGLCGVEVRDVP